MHIDTNLTLAIFFLKFIKFLKNNYWASEKVRRINKIETRVSEERNKVMACRAS